MSLLTRWIGYAVVALLAAPLMVLFAVSVTPNRSIFHNGGGSAISLANYSQAVQGGDALSRIAMTALVSGGVALVSLALASDLLWRLDQRNSTRRNSLGGLLLLVSRSLPTVAVCAPIFILSRSLGGQSVIFYVLMVAILLTPLLLWLLIPSFGDFQSRFGDLLVSMGPSRTVRFLFFYLPTAGALPFLSIAVIAISAWNEGFLASALGLETLMPTIPSLLSHRGTDWGGIAALGVLSAIPGLILTISLSLLHAVERFRDSASRH